MVCATMNWACAWGTGNVQASIAGEVLEQQAIMRQCVERLEACEMSHVVLCSHLKDALVEQVSPLPWKLQMR